MDRAIKEIVSGIVQRSVCIACQTTKELVLKVGQSELVRFFCFFVFVACVSLACFYKFLISNTLLISHLFSISLHDQHYLIPINQKLQSLAQICSIHVVSLFVF